MAVDSDDKNLNAEQLKRSEDFTATQAPGPEVTNPLGIQVGQSRSNTPGRE